MAEATNHSAEFARLFVKHRGMLSSYVLSLVREPHLAEDMIQDVAVNIMEKMDTFDGNDFGAWARTVARWHVHNHWRRQSTQKKHFQQATLDLIDTQYEGQGRSFSNWEARKDALSRCLQKIAGNIRRLLDMRYVDGLSIAAIAGKTGKTSGAVQMQIARVRDRLGECIKRNTAAQES